MYIEQMEAMSMNVHYRIAGWDDNYKQLKHIRWLCDQIAHSTGFVECTQADVDWLKAFHNRLLTQQDPLAKVYHITREAENQKPQKTKTLPEIKHEVVISTSDSSNKRIKPFIIFGSIIALAALAGIILWIINTN